MKQIAILALTIALSVNCLAQGNINYKALIKDSNGAVIANQAIDLQFQILEDGTTLSYQESHTTNTDSNGIVIVNIGEGTPQSGTFTEIDWAIADHFLNVKVNAGDGLVDLGTTQFQTVPYALSALTSSDNSNFSLSYLNTSSTPTKEEKSPALILTLDSSMAVGSTAPINQEQLLNLCGDENGCTVTLYRTAKVGAVNGQTFIRKGTLFYTPDPNSPGQYVISIKSEENTNVQYAKDGDSGFITILGIGNDCILTDTIYVSNQASLDDEIGLHLLYGASNGTNKNCICKIED